MAHILVQIAIYWSQLCLSCYWDQRLLLIYCQLFYYQTLLYVMSSNKEDGSDRSVSNTKMFVMTMFNPKNMKTSPWLFIFSYRVNQGVLDIPWLHTLEGVGYPHISYLCALATSKPLGSDEYVWSHLWIPAPELPCIVISFSNGLICYPLVICHIL